jgi:hypothetical protein
MGKSQKRILYKETIHCPMKVLLIVSAAATLAIVFFGLVFLGMPKWSSGAMFIGILSLMTVFFISMIYSWFRYSLKLKIFRSYIDNNIFLSLRGVGKGSWRQIPVECITSCSRVDYRSPIKGFWPLLLSDNAPYQPKDGSPSDRVYPLPGYVGQGVTIEYKVEKRSGAGWVNSNLTIPSNNPDSLCKILTRKE